MKAILLTRGKFAFVDDCDYEYLMQFKWHYSARGYACRSDKKHKKHFPMHREILRLKLGKDIPSDLHCDHIDNNRLNNTRDNLRVVTNQENCWNSSKTKKVCSSKYKGVCLATQRYRKTNGEISLYHKWVAYIRKNGKRYHIGVFKTEDEAALAYNKKAIELFGDYANLNVLEGVA